jgi:hypothetical protein
MRAVRFLSCVFFVSLMLGAVPARAATQTSFAALDVPGADSTEVHGVIRTGPLLQYVEVVGTYHDLHGTHGFVWSRGQFTLLNYPGAHDTWTLGINGRQEIVGVFAGSDGVQRGFHYAGGTYTKITCPFSRGFGLANVGPNAINDGGTIVGDDGPAGFARSGGECVFPIRRNALYINAINNNGKAAATIVDAANTTHGQTLLPLSANENETQVDFPGAAATWLTGINDVDGLVGYYRYGTRFFASTQGFVFTNGTFATLDYPGAFRTEPFAIDDPLPGFGSYDVVGAYSGLFGANHGFIATLTPQAQSQP